MKVYRLYSKYGRHFFRALEEEMQKEVEVRIRDHGNEDGWRYEEEEIEDVGICWNNFPHIKGGPDLFALEDDPICSVGIIRKGRSGNRTRVDDVSKNASGCGTCPYFISKKQINEIVYNQNME